MEDFNVIFYSNDGDGGNDSEEYDVKHIRPYRPIIRATLLVHTLGYNSRLRVNVTCTIKQE